LKITEVTSKSVIIFFSHKTNYSVKLLKGCTIFVPTNTQK